MGSYRTIAIGIGATPLDTVALDAATALGQRLSARRLHLVRVAEPPPAWPRFAFGVSGLEEAWRAAVSGLEQALEAVPVSAPGLMVSRKVRVGPIARELADEARVQGAELVIVASHDRRGVERAALGSVATSLLRTSTCPVMIVGRDRPGAGALGRVLAAIDLSEVSKAVLEHAFRFAAAYGGSVRVLSLYDSEFLAPALEEALIPRVGRELEALEKSYRGQVEALVREVGHPGVEVEVDVMSKAPAHNVIVDLSEMLNSELVVIGTSGHGAWHRFFLGSTAARVAADARCPVLAVPRAQPEAVREPAGEGDPILDQALA